jgi:hypothetical protein
MNPNPFYHFRGLGIFQQRLGKRDWTANWINCINGGGMGRTLCLWKDRKKKGETSNASIA